LGVATGLINEVYWEMSKWSCINVERGNIVDKLQPRNINVSFTNNSNVAIDLSCLPTFSHFLIVNKTSLSLVRPGAVSPDRALCVPTFSHFVIVNKTSLSLFLSLSLSFALFLSLSGPPVMELVPNKLPPHCPTHWGGGWDSHRGTVKFPAP
jgi:hypothetical protein